MSESHRPNPKRIHAGSRQNKGAKSLDSLEHGAVGEEMTEVVVQLFLLQRQSDPRTASTHLRMNVAHRNDFTARTRIGRSKD